jgi:hypothetical protein
VTGDLEGVTLLIAAVGTLLTAAGTFVSALYAILGHAKSTETGAAVKELGVNIDGKMDAFNKVKDELTEARVAGSFKAGEEAGEKHQQQRSEKQ